MARMCSVCGKKADTMIQTGNVVGGSVICWKCYEKITVFLEVCFPFLKLLFITYYFFEILSLKLLL